MPATCCRAERPANSHYVRTQYRSRKAHRGAGSRDNRLVMCCSGQATHAVLSDPFGAGQLLFRCDVNHPTKKTSRPGVRSAADILQYISTGCIRKLNDDLAKLKLQAHLYRGKVTRTAEAALHPRFPEGAKRHVNARDIPIRRTIQDSRFRNSTGQKAAVCCLASPTRAIVRGTRTLNWL